MGLTITSYGSEVPRRDGSVCVEIDVPDDPATPFPIKFEWIEGFLRADFPHVFTQEMLGIEDDDKALHEIIDWCEESIGPDALVHAEDEHGKLTFENPQMVRKNGYAVFFSVFYFRDEALATAFKIRWWPEEQRPREG